MPNYASANSGSGPLDGVKRTRRKQPSTDDSGSSSTASKTTKTALATATVTDTDTESVPVSATKVTEERGFSGGRVDVPFWKKKWFLITTAIVVVLLAAGGAAAWKMMTAPKPVKHLVIATPTPAPTPSPTPVQAADPLTGVLTDPATAANPVIGVMIENLYPDARPQSGLSQAGMVYEALAEGGITRFLALFQEPLPTTIGPVRSLRPYYLDWGLEHDIPVAHAGGSQPALAEILSLGMKDINALVYDGSYFYRTTDRVAPHNLYINATNLTNLDKKLGYAAAPDFKPLPRKNDSPVTNPPHADININFSYGQYNVEYKYDAPTNSYARFMGGAPHVDRNTNKQIYVKNIIVQRVNTSYSTQADGKPETDLQIVGSGTCYVFEDGTVIQGTWTKASDHAQTQFLDASGNPISFNRGNTWVDVVPNGNSVTY
jgi:Protein of unknown function (DUF3048) N-terminal domain/Protein of unknown function (DUF3048) C-terminal domain